MTNKLGSANPNRIKKHKINKGKILKNKYTNAFIIGFMVAVVVWSVAKNTFGLFAIIPLFIIYMLVNKDKIKKDFEKGYEDAYKN